MPGVGVSLGVGGPQGRGPAPAAGITRVDLQQGNMLDPATTDTCTYGVALEENDLILYFAVAHTDQIPVIERPTGFTNIFYDGFDRPSYSVAYKRVTDTPETATTIPKFRSVNRDQPWVMQVFRGVDPTTPLDVTPQVHGGATLVQQLPAITPVTDGAYLAMLWCLDDDLGSVMTTPPEGYTSETWSGPTSGNTLCSLGFGSKVLETAAAEPIRGYTLSTTDENFGIIVPLRPAA